MRAVSTLKRIGSLAYRAASDAKWSQCYQIEPFKETPKSPTIRHSTAVRLEWILAGSIGWLSKAPFYNTLDRKRDTIDSNL